jgi:hypothetical protein
VAVDTSLAEVAAAILPAAVDIHPVVIANQRETLRATSLRNELNRTARIDVNVVQLKK